jgi:hypothetical protein
MQALQTGVHENFILRDPAICDYLDRLLGGCISQPPHYSASAVCHAEDGSCALHSLCTKNRARMIPLPCLQLPSSRRRDAFKDKKMVVPSLASRRRSHRLAVHSEPCNAVWSGALTIRVCG